MRPRHLAVFGLLTLCLALAACGGGPTATPAAPAATVPAAASPTAPAATATRPATSPTAAAASAPAASATTGTAAAAPPPTASPPTSVPSATTAPATVAPTVVPAPTAAASASVGDGKTVTVRLMNYAIALDTATATAGMVTFKVTNDGPAPHNFTLTVDGADKGTMTLDPKATATLALDLKPGTYTYRCTIPGHDLLGMKGTLTVK